MLLVALTAVPGFAMAWMFGGVPLADVVLTVLLLVFALWLFAAIGLFCSSLARTSWAVAALYAYGLVFLIGTGTLAAYLIGASMQMESAVRPLLALNPFITLFSVPDGITGQLAQVLPFQYRLLLDSGAQQEPVRPGRGPLPALGSDLHPLRALTLLFVTLSSVAIDPCHRFKSRRWARSLYTAARSDVIQRSTSETVPVEQGT